MLRTGEAVRMFSFCLEPISINSVLGRLLIVASIYSNKTKWYSRLYQRR